MQARTSRESVVVACPDARPPAYQAAIGLGRAGMLKRFVTSYYHDPESLASSLARRISPRAFARWQRVLVRRHDVEIPAARVSSVPSVDVALKLESRLAGKRPRLKRAVAKARTHWFDRHLARRLAADPPETLLVFSDVGAGVSLPLCRRLGIGTVLSMVHGDVREEAEVLETEAALAPDFFPMYLGDGALDQVELSWLHERRLRDLALADLVLVPSDHIADELASHGLPRERVRVIPYAADCRRFRPLSGKRHEASCTFLFAGGISQRKGIKYLLEAWAQVRRPGWKLQLLGAAPKNLGPMAGLLDGVELLGRVGHPEVPAHMAAADVFVFPSLFEGSAVVTYEALACGLPSIVTAAAGSVVRHGAEGFHVPARNVAALAAEMERLGDDPRLRARMSAAARSRALDFDWPRYHVAVADAVSDLSRSQSLIRTEADRRAPSHRRAEAAAKPNTRIR
ncbi:glycosyltransferase family 4 protein [Paludisphaera borealis]|nr:glycosyltransferase family 4 protein [Paludisphaera borealis]